MKKITLDDVKKIIRANNLEEAYAWCNQVHLKVRTTPFGDFVYIQEFEVAWDFEHITDLIEEYGDKWYSIYNEYRRCKGIPILPSKVEEITEVYPRLRKGNLVALNRKDDIDFESPFTEDTYTIKEAANILKRSTKTIRNRIKVGALKTMNDGIGKNKQHRIPKAELERLCFPKKISA